MSQPLKTLDLDKLCEICKGMSRREIEDLLIAQKKSGKVKRKAPRLEVMVRKLLSRKFTIQELMADSPIEQIMEIEFLYEKMSFKRKVPIGRYELDFAIENNGIKIDVECDGYDWHYKTWEQVERDRKRDKYLMNRGWVVMRFSGAQIQRNPTKCVEQIKKLLPAEELEAKYKKEQ